MDIQEKKAQLEKFAKENFVPILRKNSGKFLSEQLEKYKPQRNIIKYFANVCQIYL